MIQATFQTNATQDGAGSSYGPAPRNTSLAFSIRGTSTSRSAYFESADPSGVYVPCDAINVNRLGMVGNQTSGGDNIAPESWQVQIPAGWSFRVRVGQIVGGDVTVIGIID